MIRSILYWGSLAGLIVGGLLFATTVSMADQPPSMSLGMLLGYTGMLVALSLIFVAVKRHRDRAQGGVIRFWPAFAMGLGISLVAGVFYVLAWEAALAVSGMDFGAKYAEMLLDQRRAAGAGAEELATYAAELQTFRVQYANPLYRIPMTFTEIVPVGVLVSLVSAALLRNPRFMPLRRG